MAGYTVECYAGRYIFTWDKWGVRITAGQLRSHSDGRITAQVEITVAAPGGPKKLFYGQLNLSAVRSREELARKLNSRWELEKGEDSWWDKVIEDFCREVLEREQKGEPITTLAICDCNGFDYLAEPLIIDRNIQLIYGPGGSGKSLLAMAIALAVQNGLGEIKGYWPNFGVKKQVGVLYLDWETDYETASRRATLLATPLIKGGFKGEIRLPYYKRCIIPLADDTPNIALAVAENDVGLVIVDSAGPACAGDVESADTALRFFGALRTICAETGAASLVLTHVTKAERRGEGKGRLPIGSIYFENIPRMTWEIRKEDDDEPSIINLAIFNRKHNETAPAKPFGVRFYFYNDCIFLEKAEIKDVGDIEQTQIEMVFECLAGGPRSLSDIASYLEVSRSSACHILRRLQTRGKVVKIRRGVWALAADEDEVEDEVEKE